MSSSSHKQSTYRLFVVIQLALLIAVQVQGWLQQHHPHRSDSAPTQQRYNTIDNSKGYVNYATGKTFDRKLLVVPGSSNDKNEYNEKDNDKEKNIGVEEYRNAATKILSNFITKKDDLDGAGDIDTEVEIDPLGQIDFDAPKISPSTSVDDLAKALDYELIESEWFVTGKVNPSYFSPDFQFQDPDVQLKGIESYARGVYKLFDQSTSRAEIISTVVNTTTTSDTPIIITCTWRLSGNVNILFGLPIKPYIVYTDFQVDPSTSLIVFQEDRFDLPPWDILLR